MTLSGAVYLNALHNPYVYDDQRTVQTNASITNPRDWRGLLLYDLTRPVTNISFAVDYAVWGDGPFGFHLTSVVLHMVNVGLVFALAWGATEDVNRRARLTGADPIPPRLAAFAAAALFGVHPLMTEAVGYISARSDVLSTTFFLVATLAARRWMIGGRARWWVAGTAVWVVSTLTKEATVLWPAVVAVYDAVFFEDNEQRRRRWRRFHLPILGLAVALGVARSFLFAFVEHPGGVTIHASTLLGELDVIRNYLSLLLLPVRQTIFHDVPLVTSTFDRAVLTGLAVVGLLVAMIYAMRQRFPVSGFGVAWFLLVLAPASILAVLRDLPGLAERRVYLGSIGLFLAAGAAVSWAIACRPVEQRRLRALFVTAFVVSLFWLSARTVLRNVVWSDPVTLWREAADLAPNAWLPQTVLGESLHEAGRHEEAVEVHRVALALAPHEDVNYLKLATCLVELGRFDQASRAIEDLERLNPQSEILPVGFGMVALLSGHLDTARGDFEAAIKRNKADLLALRWLAILEEDYAGDPSTALRWCEEIRGLLPMDRANAECIQRNQAKIAKLKTQN